ncbi:MAG: hypothetical protein IJD79_00610 [Clostridia bacterium]|nr:hypothetical protein [Clostridia bacterium]
MNDNLDTELEEEELDESFDSADIEEENEDVETEDEPSENIDNDGEEEDAVDDDEELEYDEDGNVIIGEGDETEAEAQAEEANTDSAPAEETPKPDEKDAEIERLTKENAGRALLIKTVLEKMGMKIEDDLDASLLRYAAEAEGVTPEEFKKKQTEAERAAEAERVYRQVLLDKMVSDDLAALHAEFPETRDFKKFEDIPNCKRFGELRDLGLSPKEAYTAANPDRAREDAASSARQQNINETKDHLRSNVPKASKDNSVKISRAEMEECREMFPNLSDKEIIALYKKTK